ncbi:MAG: glycosyltransferase [Nitrososphaerota archaeon]
MLPFVSVIVITKNNLGTIERCVSNLLQQNYPKELYEIIFVDGNSSDGTLEILMKYMQTHSTPSIRIYTENVGTMGYARNLGITKAKGDILAFIDGDAYPTSNWLTDIVKNFMDCPNLAMVGGLDVLTFQDSARDIISSWRRLKKSWGIKAVSKIRTVNFAIKRDVITVCGGFDPKLSHFDEAELMARLFFKRNVREVLYDPSIIVFHQRGKSGLISRIRKTFNKTVIGVPVLFRTHMIRLALSNPLSTVCTSLFFVPASLLSLFVLFLMVLGVFPIEYFLYLLILVVILILVYMINMKRFTGKFVPKVFFILALDCFVRVVGTLFGLIRWLSLSIIAKFKNLYNK